MIPQEHEVDSTEYTIPSELRWRKASTNVIEIARFA